MTNTTPTAPAEYRTSELRFRNRSNPRYKLDLDRPVKVYRNLSSKCFSIMQDSIVKAHADAVTLENVDWKVSQKGRRRVIRDGKKNVHAFAVGHLVPATTALDAAPVVYNPYNMDSFRVEISPEEAARLTKSAAALLNAQGQSFALYNQEDGQ
jgi:hypothetical protein